MRWHVLQSLRRTNGERGRGWTPRSWMSSFSTRTRFGVWGFADGRRTQIGPPAPRIPSWPPATAPTLHTQWPTGNPAGMRLARMGAAASSVATALLDAFHHRSEEHTSELQ